MSNDTQVNQEAPERITISNGSGIWQTYGSWKTSSYSGDNVVVEYVRADLLATVRQDVWQEAIRVAQQSTKKSQAAALNIAAAEILIRRLERAAANSEKGEGNG